MDPVGPWYASYNRLAGVQPSPSGDFHHHHAAAAGVGAGAAGVPSTSAGQLLLQAAHTTALAGQLGVGVPGSSPAFNPGFLSPPAVGYDAMFSPLFTPKPGHYTPSPAQHRAQQALAQAQAHTKQGAEADLAALRENYAHHHQQGAGFFDQGAAAAAAAGQGAASASASASASAALAWQGASPFGILPHESVVPSSPGAPAKAPPAPYDGFAAHFGSPSQGLNSVSAKARSGSPQVSAPSKTSSSGAGGFYQAPASFPSQEGQGQLPQSSQQQAQSQPSQQQPDYKRRTSGAGAGASSQQQSGASSEASKMPDGKKLAVSGVGSGFMASYLKFLQGERDTSPPPATRGGRKGSWSRSSASNSGKTFNSNAQNDSKSAPESNGAMNAVSMNANIVNSSQNSMAAGMSSAMIAKDDDRFFPIPKDRKRKFDGSEESYDEEDRRGNKPVLNVPAATTASLNTEKVGNSKKGRGNGSRSAAGAALQPMVPATTKKPRQMPSEAAAAQQQYYYQQPNEAAAAAPAPTGHRDVRRKVRRMPTSHLGSQYNQADADDGLLNFFHSDSDPSWTQPNFKDGDDDEVDDAGRSRKVKHCRPSGSRNHSTSNILSAAAHSAGIDYADYSSEEESNVKKINQQRAIQHLGQQTINTRQPEEMPYQPGEFVVIKTELSDVWPSIWRVDGKSLLQKYEPYEQNGKVLYKNISTYAAWNPENKKLYTLVPVRVRAQTLSETIVELLRNEIVLDDNDFIVKRMQETIVYQDNFEVYIQTLISHALDPNFLTEIFQEQDEYFLSNVKTVDDITEERRRRIIGSSWSRGLEVGLATWPCFSSTELGPTVSAIMCAACRIQRAQSRIQLYGQPYNPATLERCQPDPRFAYEKETIVCRGCCQRAELYSRIAHQKYLMFLECNKRVEDKRTQDPHKDTTLILNELLADEPWLSQLFRDVRQSWAEAESMERKSRQGMTARQHM